MRSREEAFKRWLAVLIAGVTFLIGVTTFLQTNVSVNAATYYRRAQENALMSTGVRTRGQQEVAFASNTVAREYDELWANVQRQQDANDSQSAGVYQIAAQEILKQSPFLMPPYTELLDNGRRSTNVERYEVDTWVITATLLSEKREAAASEANAWDTKSNNYIAAIAVFAVSLFLFGLASTLGGFVRGMFVVVGLGLTGVSMLWVFGTLVWPVHHLPDMAIQQFAQGYGLQWQYKYPEAIENFNQALKTDPDYANAYYQRGMAWLGMESPDYKKAIQDLESARRLAPANYQIWANLGWTYYLSGDYALSISTSQKALAMNNADACGAAFNVALARLATGNAPQAEKDYDAAIALCESGYKNAVAAGSQPSSSLWYYMKAGALDIENLLCQTHKRYCYPGRDRPDVTKVGNRDIVLSIGEKYRRRIKEAWTALEYKHTTTVQPTGAKMQSLVFGTRFTDANDRFQSYISNQTFPYRHDGDIYALFQYAGLNLHTNVVYKVYYNGDEKEDLRYVEDWSLGKSGVAEKAIDSWYLLGSGHYDVEVYGDGELLGSGSFEINPETVPPATLPNDVRPSAPVNVGRLLLADNFINNDHGWWSGSWDKAGNATDVGQVSNGEYLVVTHEPDSFWDLTCQDCGNLGDFYYEATTRYVSGPTDYGYGLVIRGDKGMRNMYLFAVSAGGSYAIGKVVDGKYTALAEWTSNTAIRPKGVNRLGVLARGNSLEFFVNGQSLKRITDSSYTKGYIGFSVGTTDLQAAFSQLRVWQLP